ncbi:MAG: hypothetical protein AB8C84_05610 [Oligoflexales bacterium]
MKLKVIICVWFFSLSCLVYLSSKHSMHHSSSTQSPFGLHIPQKIRSIFTLGHHRLYQDYLFIWSIQEIMSPAKQEVTHQKKIIKTFQDIAKEHIRIEPYYMMTCFYINEVYSRPEDCAAITHEGLKIFPGSWRISMTQAYIEAYLLHNHLTGAAMYRIAAQHQLAPEWVGRLADKLENKSQNTPEDYESIRRLMKSLPGFLDSKFLPNATH